MNTQNLLLFLISHHHEDQLHHTVCFKFRGKKLHVCARGLGKYSALISSTLFFFSFNLPDWLRIFILVGFPLPSFADWITQTLSMRESKNWMRVCTGFFLGCAYGLLLKLMIVGDELFVFGILVLISFTILAFLVKMYGRRIKN